MHGEPTSPARVAECGNRDRHLPPQSWSARVSVRQWRTRGLVVTDALPCKPRSTAAGRGAFAVGFGCG